jgi:hypothetical protein
MGSDQRVLVSDGYAAEQMGNLDAYSQNWEGERPTSGMVAPGIAVRSFRLGAGITQRDLSLAAGVSASTISRFERGLHAPRVLTRPGDGANGIDGIGTLAVVHAGLAGALGYPDVVALTMACAAFRE